MLFRRKRHLTGIADVERDTTDVYPVECGGSNDADIPTLYRQTLCYIRSM